MLTTNIAKTQEETGKVKSSLTNLKLKNQRDIKEQQYPIDRTVVAQNVWCDEGKDVVRVAETIIHKGLKLTEINIVRVIRKSGWESGKGLLKIELSSQDELKRVLKEKKLLRDAPVKELRRVFLRQSKKKEMLIMERNIDMLLNDIGMRDDYVRLSSGYLVRWDNHLGASNRGSRFNQCGGRGRGRGQGHGVGVPRQSNQS